MALARCEELHLDREDRERLRGRGYAWYIPARYLPNIIWCGRPGCPNKAAVVLRPGERGILAFPTNAIALNVEAYHEHIIPLAHPSDAL
jgi:hypothetical protein